MAEAVFNMYEARSNLSRLVERAANGEEIIIAKDGKPVAKLVPLERARTRRRPGGWEGQVFISEDFDAPLPDDLLAGFEGEE